MLSRHSRKVLRYIISEGPSHNSTQCSILRFSTYGDGRGGSVGDYFSALRWKAANALTSTLPEEERNLLLDKLSTNKPEVNSDKLEDNDAPQETGFDNEEENGMTNYQPSIEEAVAAAKLREAERFEEKWERDKETLVAEAEAAALARVESVLTIQKRQIAFEAWKSQLEREKKEREDSSNKIEVDSDTEIPNEMHKVESLGEHPILGPIIADLGYKRIHLASSKNLATIPVWKKQRIYRHGRSKSMATDKIKTLHLGLPGIIGISENINGNLFIIDGQHRIGMLKVMKEKVSDGAFDFERVLVEVFPTQMDQDEESQAKEIFLEVNKAEPVKLVDLPGVAKAKDRKIINEVAERLRDKYPDMFSESQRCRAPHLNVDNIRDALFASKIIEKHSIKTSKALEDWILERNQLLATEFKEEDSKKSVSANALKKAEKFQFYLGLDSGWLYK